jgi:hypothetical protein
VHQLVCVCVCVCARACVCVLLCGAEARSGPHAPAALAAALLYLALSGSRAAAFRSARVQHVRHHELTRASTDHLSRTLCCALITAGCACYRVAAGHTDALPRAAVSAAARPGGSSG